MFYEQPIFYAGFLAFVMVLLALDLGVLNRKAHAPSLKEAAWLSALWVSIALLFGVWVYWYLGPKQGVEYFTGWLLEKALSVDNLFVFVLVFSFFKVPPKYHHRVLFWGVLGALIMRGILIFVGASLIQRFDWIIYIFGAFLIYTGIRLGTTKEDAEPDLTKNPLLRLAKRFLPFTNDYHEEKFAVRQAGKLVFTPLVLVLIIVESTDLVFAVDSIPAVIAVTKEPFIIFTSNVMAILGLRALYFLLAGAMDKFHYLKPALSIILTFVGIKMVGEKLFHDQLHDALIGITADPEFFLTIASMVFILAVLTVAIIASLVRPRALPHGEQAKIEAH
jgi:tellurite resistance protein TerC